MFSRQRSPVCDVSQCLGTFILVRTILLFTVEIEDNAFQGDKSCGVLKENMNACLCTGKSVTVEIPSQFHMSPILPVNRQQGPATFFHPVVRQIQHVSTHEVKGTAQPLSSRGAHLSVHNILKCP